MKHIRKVTKNGLTRRRFIRAGAMKLRGTGFATLMSAGSIYNNLKRLSIGVIVFISCPVPAYNQRPASSPVTKLVPPAHGKIPVAFIIGRSAEMIDFAGPWETFYFAYARSRNELPGR